MFKHKYLKYKLKNKEIEKILGGGTDNKTIILCSHNSIIQCLLSLIMSQNENGLKRLKDEGGKIRFKNCCIIKFVISKNGCLIKLVYEGQLNKETKDKYYVIQKKKENDVVFSDYNFDIKDLKLQNITNDYTIYLIRHGEAEHNVEGTMSKLIKGITGTGTFDTILTEEKKPKSMLSTFTKGSMKQLSDASYELYGISMAETAGKELNKILEQTNSESTIDLVFSSDLRRTRQTLERILGNINQSKLTTINEIIVLPCAHELNYFSNKNITANVVKGYCYATKEFGQETQFQNENKMICDYTKCVDKYKCTKDSSGKEVCVLCNTEHKCDLCTAKPCVDQESYCCIVGFRKMESGIEKTLKTVKINWDYYKKFGGRSNCSTTNMLEQVVKYVEK